MAITVRELLERKSPVMISLYMPTYRTSPDREQNEVRYRNLVDEVRSQVGDGVTVDEDYVKFDHEVGAIYRY